MKLFLTDEPSLQSPVTNSQKTFLFWFGIYAFTGHLGQKASGEVLETYAWVAVSQSLEHQFQEICPLPASADPKHTCGAQTYMQANATVPRTRGRPVRFKKKHILRASQAYAGFLVPWRRGHRQAKHLHTPNKKQCVFKGPGSRRILWHPMG